MAAGRILKTNWMRIPGIYSRTAREDLNYMADFINRLQMERARGGTRGGAQVNQQWICVAIGASGVTLTGTSSTTVTWGTLYGRSPGCYWSAGTPEHIQIADDSAWYDLSFVGYFEGVNGGAVGDLGHVQVAWSSDDVVVCEPVKSSHIFTDADGMGYYYMAISAAGVLHTEQMAYWDSDNSSRMVDLNFAYTSSTGPGEVILWGTAIITRLLTQGDEVAT